MIIRKFKSLLVIFFVLTTILSFQSLSKEDPKDKILITILKYVLTQGHYQPQEINDSFSKNIYDEFLDRLDHSKLYFLQSDIDEFSEFRTQIDDQIKSGDLSFFFLVYNRLMERTEESMEYTKEILAHKFDFNKDEKLNVDYEKTAYATDVNQLIFFWHKQLKFSTLINIHDEITSEDDKKKADKTYIKKSFSELESLARETTLNNMNESYSRINELKYSDWFSTYVNCISEEFDPHTTYLNPAFKKSFDISIVWL